VDQIALNYNYALPFMQSADISSLSYLKHDEAIINATDKRFPTLHIENIDLKELKVHAFWKVLK
jgi:hypothetical protein